MKPKLALSLILLLSGYSFLGIKPASSTFKDSHPPLYFDHLTRENGLPSNTVNSVIQDFQGFIWIGTTNGIARYDGHDMKIFRSIPGDASSLVDNTIFSIYQTSDSLIWIGTGNGLSTYDEKSHTLKNFPFNKKGNGFPVQWINTFLEEKKGSVWVGTREGLVHVTGTGFHFDHIRTTRCNKPQVQDFYINVVSSIVQDPRNPKKLLLGTSAGLVRFDKEKRVVDRDYGGPPGKERMIRELFLDSDHKLWACGWGIGVGCFDLNTETWQSFSPVNWGITVLSIIPRNKDEFWVATDDEGLGIFNKITHQFYFYKSDPGNTKSIASDYHLGGAYFNHHQDFWIWGNGIDIQNTDYYSFHQVKVPFKYWFINTFYKEETTGEVFVGAYYCKGMPVHDTKKDSWRLIPFDQPMPQEGYSINQFLKDSKGRLWVSTRSSLCFYDPDARMVKQFRTQEGAPLHLSNPAVVYGLDEDIVGNLWVGTRYDGVIRIDPSREKADYFKNIPGNPNSLLEGTHFIAIQADNLRREWFGSRYGISIYDPVKKSFDNSLADTLLKNGIRKKWVNGIEKDSMGRMWLAIDGAGLVRVDVRANGSFGVKLFHSGNGLNDPGVGCISKDPDADFWIVDAGLQFVNPYLGSFRLFDDHNGLHENPGGSQMAYIDHAGNIFIGDSLGYETRNIKSIRPVEKQPLNLVIEAIEINGKVTAERAINTGTINLTADQNNITFHYTAISFHHSGPIYYRYKLAGYDREWVDGETSREARYTNLPPGKFTFCVSATLGIGWFKSRESIQLLVRPFFWQTWWFMMICVIVISMITFFIYRYRVNQLLKVERLRTRIATDLHDDVSSTLSSISILSDMAGKLNENPKSAGMISEIGTSAHEMLERIDDIIWSVNPANDKFQDLGLRIREYAIPLFESKSIRFAFSIPETLGSMRLQMEIRRNVYLIAKEAVNNLVKYADCSDAAILFREESGLLIMEITDNGKGFDPDKPTSRNGLRNMKKRAGQIGGILTIRSQTGSGTEILLKVKTI